MVSSDKVQRPKKWELEGGIHSSLNGGILEWDKERAMSCGWKKKNGEEAVRLEQAR
jgi:hypothetical protein